MISVSTKMPHQEVSKISLRKSRREDYRLIYVIKFFVFKAGKLKMIDGAHLEPILDPGYLCGFVFCLHGNDENNEQLIGNICISLEALQAFIYLCVRFRGNHVNHSDFDSDVSLAFVSFL